MGCLPGIVSKRSCSGEILARSSPGLVGQGLQAVQVWIPLLSSRGVVVQWEGGEEAEGAPSANTRLPAPVATLLPPNPCAVTPFAKSGQTSRRPGGFGNLGTLGERQSNTKERPSLAALNSRTSEPVHD